MNTLRITVGMIFLSLLCISCGKTDDDELETETKSKLIETQAQAESVARDLWQLIAFMDEQISTGYEYTNKTFSGGKFEGHGEFELTGSKTNDKLISGCTITKMEKCVMNNVKYNGHTFNGWFQYEERNYHGKTNSSGVSYKRQCSLWSSIDEEQGLKAGIQVTSDDINDFFYVTAEKDNTIDKSYNSYRTPAYFRIETASGKKFNFYIK